MAHERDSPLAVLAVLWHRPFFIREVTDLMLSRQAPRALPRCPPPGPSKNSTPRHALNRPRDRGNPMKRDLYAEVSARIVAS